MQEVNRIEAYSLMEFSQKVQEAILAGWKFDFDSIQNCPQSFGSYLAAGMVKGTEETKQPEAKEQEEPEQEQQEEGQQEAPKKVGRKAK